MKNSAGQSLEPIATPVAGMSARAALQLEYAIISLGIFALALIFQPFNLSLFGIGCALVFLAGLLNNLLPLCQPGVRVRSVVTAGLIVAMIFCIMLLIAIAAAYLYGALFVIATAPDVSEPFYRQPFVWGIAVMAVLLAMAVAALSSGKTR